jgi:hypothetical protein
VVYFVEIWCGNGGPNPPVVLRDSVFFSVFFAGICVLASYCSSAPFSLSYLARFEFFFGVCLV